jgi:hypothetical protein
LGGYAGDPSDPDLRDIDAFPATLCGDIGVVGDVSDNSYHVIQIILSDASIDGVTISGGKGRGGMTFKDSTIAGNSGSFDGGIFNEGSLNVTDVRFNHNVAGRNGDAIFNNGHTVIVTARNFPGNKAAKKTGLGTAIYSTMLANVSVDSDTSNSRNGVAVFRES